MSALAWLAHDPAMTWKAFWWCIAAGISNAIAIVCLYRALAVGKMGLTAPVAAVLTAVLPVVAEIRSQGLPSGFQITGFALAFVAIWLIAKPEGAAGRPQGLGLAILAGIGFSGFLLMIRLANTPAIFWPVAAVRISSVILVSAVIIFQRGPWLPRQNSLWIAALAGCFHTPVIFLSGDQDAAADLRAIVPQAETAVVKEGLSNYACISLSAEASRGLIREGAARAMRRISEIPPYRIEGPVSLQIEYTTRNALGMDAHLRAGAEIVDARTIRYSGKDFMEAWTRFQRP